MMKVCIVCYGGYPDPAGVVTGNSVRAWYLAKGLLQHGFSIDWLYPQFLDSDDTTRRFTADDGIQVQTYDGGGELLDLLQRKQPAAVLVGYWELLEHFPEDYPLPLIADVVAPRILEAMYEEQRDLGQDVDKLLRLYRRAHLFLAGNERQRHFLLPWLLLAGFDCRSRSPSISLPISVQAPATIEGRERSDTLRFVTGGVSWPWRNSKPWLEALVAALGGQPKDSARLHLLSGKYLYAAEEAGGGRHDWPEGLVVSESLKPYGEMGEFFAQQCDIGIELADQNTEREYSQSFRVMEFLRAGLPVICNGYLEMAEHIRAFDAGWVIERQDEIPGLIRTIIADPALVQEKSTNALRLAREQFDCVRNTEQLAAYIRDPQRPELIAKPLLGSKAEKVPAAMHAEAGEPPPALPEAQQSLRGRLADLAGSVLRKVFKGKGDRVMSVSRSDIFPANHGAAVKIDRTAWGLSHRVEEVYLVTDSRRIYHRYRQGRRVELKYPFWLGLPWPSRDKGRQWLADNGIPMDNAFLFDAVYDWNLLLRSLYVALRHGPRRYLAEFPLYARAGLLARRMLGGRVVISEHNVEYQRLREQYPDMPTHGFRLARDLELRMCQAADAVVAVSERDRALLAADGIDAERLHLISHGVDLEQFDQVQKVDLQSEYGIDPGTPVLVYHGIYLYPPNLQAMQVMAEEILPLLNERGIHPKVLAVGRNPPEEALHPDIVFTGPVDSVAPYLCAADMAVVPLLQGGGTRMKLLDYFAAKLPVVSTAKGAEGLPLNDGAEILIRDRYADFADAVVSILGDAALAQGLSQQGRAFVDRLDWKNIAADYVRLFNAESLK